MPKLPTAATWFEEIVLYVLWAIVLIICWWCIYAFLRAIFLFIFSNGKNEKIQAARSSIRYMILWMFFTIMFLFAAPSLLKFTHVKWAENYTAKAIFTYMWKILSHIWSLGNIIKESQDANKMDGQLYYNFDDSDASL